MTVGGARTVHSKQAAQQVIEAAVVVQELAASEAEVLALVGSKEAKEGNAGTS